MAASRVTPLAKARNAVGFTQEKLAEAMGVSLTTIGRWERGVVVPLPKQRRPLARTLAISLDELNDVLRRTQRVRRSERASTTAPPTEHPSAPQARNTGEGGPAGTAEDLIHAAVPRLRRALDRLDLPDDGPTRPLATLRAEIIRASNDRLHARYGELARRIPGLITELARVGQDSDGAARRDAAALLTLALRAADGVAFKFGYLDLSARMIDLMRTIAQLSEDPLLQAAVAYVRTETFFASGDLDAAAHALDVAADEVPLRDTAPAAAAFGALHMRAAVVAGRAGQADRAGEHLRDAHRVAAAVPEGVYHGTAFGPASVRIHELAVAVELRDALGIEQAAVWRPPRTLPAERRSHYYIELANAQISLGAHEDAYRSLQGAHRAAPEHTRTHPQVRRTLSALLRTHGSPSSGLLDLAAWTRAR